MKKLLMMGLLGLTACHPNTVIQGQEVKVAVPVACAVATPAEPAWNVPAALKGTFPDQVAAIAADLDLAKGYIGTLKAALSACQESPDVKDK